MATQKQTKVISKRKKFIDVEIPLIKTNISLVANSVGDTEGKTIKFDLTRQLRGKSVEAVLKVKVKNDKAIAYPIKLKLMPYFIRRMIRKRISYVEDSFETPSQESLIKVKPFIITRNKVSRVVRKTIRNQAKNWIEDYIAEKKDAEIFNDILANKLQKPLSLRLKKTYPLSLCEIRILEIKRPLEKNEIPKKKEKKEIQKPEKMNQIEEIEEEIKKQKVKEAEEEIKETQKKAAKKEKEETPEKTKPKTETEKETKKGKKEMNQQTLVLIKPDGVQKKLIGEIIRKFEDNGIKISAMKMIRSDEELAKKHYPLDEEWAKIAFEKTKKSAQEENREIPFSNHLEFGQTLQNWLIEFITESPIIAMVLKGPNAITLVRDLIGATEPCKAEKGTIRYDFASEESYEKANSVGRALRNLVHASDSPENAEREISVWFSKDEIWN